MEIIMSEQRNWIKIWARTVGMPIGETDQDAPTNPAISKKDVKKALAFRTIWIVLHVFTCGMIIAGNGKTLGLW